MNNESIMTISISVGAILFSIYSFYVSTQKVEISIIHSLQELVLEKARDCNMLFQEAKRIENKSIDKLPSMIAITDLISEITISRQLIDNSLREYKLNKRRNFFLLQFWTQLNTSLRIFIQRHNFDGVNDSTEEQVEMLRGDFMQFFHK